MNQYQEPPVTSLAALEAALAMGDSSLISDRLIGLALQGFDADWLTSTALDLTTHPSLNVRKASVTTLGHIARIHRTIDRDRVMTRLHSLSADPDLSGRVADALDDIEQFAP